MKQTEGKSRDDDGDSFPVFDRFLDDEFAEQQFLENRSQDYHAKRRHQWIQVQSNFFDDIFHRTSFDDADYLRKEESEDIADVHEAIGDAECDKPLPEAHPMLRTRRNVLTFQKVKDTRNPDCIVREHTCQEINVIIFGKVRRAGCQNQTAHNLDCRNCQRNKEKLEAEHGKIMLCFF